MVDHGMGKMFMSLAIGYVLCILANKEKKALRTVGFTLGVSVIVLSLLLGIASSIGQRCFTDDMMKIKCHAAHGVKGAAHK